jgi:hypothetical protein
MKYLITLLLGFVIGAAIAAGLLYVNPLTVDAGQPLPAADATFFYASPVTSELAFASDGLSRLESHPADVPDLWETAIAKSALSLVVLRDRAGVPVGVASRTSYPAEASELLATGAILNDDWLISVPGSGSLFVSSQGNWWPFLKTTVIPSWYFGQPWSGPMVVDPTVGPGVSGYGVVTGATGAFVGRFGQATEHYVIREFDDRVGLRSVEAALSIAWESDQAGGPRGSAAD